MIAQNHKNQNVWGRRLGCDIRYSRFAIREYRMARSRRLRAQFNARRHAPRAQLAPVTLAANRAGHVVFDILYPVELVPFAGQLGRT